MKFLDVSRELGGSLVNESIADQVLNGAEAYLSGSQIAPPSIPVRTHFIWKGWMSKTAAGIVAPTFNIRLGALGTIADAVRLALVSPAAQTAAVDSGFFEIDAVMRAIGATAVINAVLKLGHNSAATGFAAQQSVVVSGLSAAFDMSAIMLPFIGLSVDPGAAGVWTFQAVTAEMRQT